MTKNVLTDNLSEPLNGATTAKVASNAGEFAFMADWFFTVNGVRDNIEIELATPLPGAFTKPVASAMLGKLCEGKNVKVTPNFQLARVVAER